MTKQNFSRSGKAVGTWDIRPVLPPTTWQKILEDAGMTGTSGTGWVIKDDAGVAVGDTFVVDGQTYEVHDIFPIKGVPTSTRGEGIGMVKEGSPGPDGVAAPGFQRAIVTTP